MCLQRVLEDGYGDEDDDDALKSFKDNQSISFKIALHTLIKNEILLEYDDEE